MADVPSVLRSLRDQRMYLVQTVTQYSFVYKTLVAYLQSSRLIWQYDFTSASTPYISVCFCVNIIAIQLNLQRAIWLFQTPLHYSPVITTLQILKHQKWLHNLSIWGFSYFSFLCPTVFCGTMPYCDWTVPFPFQTQFEEKKLMFSTVHL